MTALNQAITASDDDDSDSEQLTGLIETNADIQAGDSGGSLVNTSGQVIGIDTAASAGLSVQSSGTQGYAITINEAISIAKQIEAGTGSAAVHIGGTAYLGVTAAQGSCNGSGFGGGFGDNGNGDGSGNDSGNSSSGALICSVISSAAQESGLVEGDTITSVENHAVSSPTALTNLLESYHPGDKVTIGWTDSSGQSHTASVQLTSGPPR